MARSIDPRRETLRGTQWQNDTAALFGTRVAEPILVSGQRDRTQNRPDIWSQAIRAIKSIFVLASRGPSTPTGAASSSPSPWIPACGNVIQFKVGGLTASGAITAVSICPLVRSVDELATSKRAQRRQRCHFPNARMALANWITAPQVGTQGERHRACGPWVPAFAGMTRLVGQARLRLPARLTGDFALRGEAVWRLAAPGAREGVPLGC